MNLRARVGFRDAFAETMRAVPSESGWQRQRLATDFEDLKMGI
jgi:hypothetical protein